MQPGTAILIILLLFCVRQVYAQADTLWTMILPHDGQDEVCTKLFEHENGRYWVAANRRMALRDTDMQLHLVSDSGGYQFNLDFDFPRHQHCFDMLRLSNGENILVGSWTDGSLTPDHDIYWIRVSSEGDSLDGVSIHGEDNERLFAGAALDSGRFVGAGYTETYGAGADDFYLVFGDTISALTDQRTYGGDDDEQCNAMVVLPDGGFLLAGWSHGFTQGSSDLWMVRTDAVGDSLWSRSLGGPLAQVCNAMVRDSTTGDFIFAGHSNFSFWMTRTDSLGEPRWSRTYDGDQAYGLIQTADGGFLLVGEKYIGDEFGFDGHVVRTDADGSELWSRTIHAYEFDRFADAKQTADFGFLLAGTTDPGGVDHSWVVKLGGELPVVTIEPVESEQVRLRWVAPLPGIYRIFSTANPNHASPLGGADWYLETVVQNSQPAHCSWLDPNPLESYRNYGIEFIGSAP